MIHYQYDISLSVIGTVTFDSFPKSKWEMHGHILRINCNSPTLLALSFAVDSNTML